MMVKMMVKMRVKMTSRFDTTVQKEKRAGHSKETVFNVSFARKSFSSIDVNLAIFLLEDSE
jgi:aromatic ring-cleaving dioxygenase